MSSFNIEKIFAGKKLSQSFYKAPFSGFLFHLLPHMPGFQAG